MTDRGRDRDRDYHRPQDSKPYKDEDSRAHKYSSHKHQNAQTYKHKSQTHQEEWANRRELQPNQSRRSDRDHAWGRGRDRRSRSPARFGYQQEVGRLSPTPYEPAYRTDWRKRARNEDENEDEVITNAPGGCR